MKNWNKEMELDENMNTKEIERFIVLIKETGVPSVEEYAEEKGLTRDDVQDEYWNKYGDIIRTARDEACD